jgi:N utilization substance protein A
VEYSDDPETFIKNVFYNYGVQSVVLENRGNIVHATVTVDPKVKGRAIGKNGRNLRIARDLVSRHHNVQSIVVA